MSTKIPIPLVVAQRLREGAQSVTRSLGCELENTAEDPPTFEELHDYLRGMWGLLDVIGRSDEDDEIEIDLREHSGALIAALGRIVPMLARWIEEIADDDEEKPLRQHEYLLVRDFEVTARREITRLEPRQ